MSKKAAVSNLQNLWMDYKKHNNIDSRNELIIKYSYLIKQVVYRLVPSNCSAIDVEDLFAYGVLGLIDAIERYDPSRNVKFETYAVFRIRGAIIDELRKQDWIPRSLRLKTRQIGEAIDLAEKRLGRAARDEEIAEILSISVEELRKIMGEIHSFTVVSLDEQITETVNAIRASSWQYNPEHATQINEIKKILANAIDGLEEKEKVIINMYYFEELTLKEIGKVLGVSESRVSQLHTRGLIKLKNKLGRLKKDLLEGELP